MKTEKWSGKRGAIALAILGAGIVGYAALDLAAMREIRDRSLALDHQSEVAASRHGDIEYAQWGAGAPILVLHGAGGGFDQGQLLAHSLGPSNRRWIAVSRFGYLRSELPDDASVTAQAEAIADLLRELRVAEVDILAMSGGVPPALKFAELYPQGVRRMALLSPAPFTPFAPDVADRPIPTWLYSAMLGNDLVYWVLTKTARNQLAQAFDARSDVRENLSEAEQVFLDELIDGFLPASARLEGVNNEGAAVAPDQTYDLASISSPTLIFHAADDAINPVAVATDIAARVPGSRATIYDRGGHLLLGHHLQIRGEVERFLAE